MAATAARTGAATSGWRAGVGLPGAAGIDQGARSEESLDGSLRGSLSKPLVCHLTELSPGLELSGDAVEDLEGLAVTGAEIVIGRHVLKLPDRERWSPQYSSSAVPPPLSKKNLRSKSASRVL